MALKPCRECKEMVSTAAKTCPHCGVPNPTGTPRVAAVGCLAVIVVVAILIAIGSISGNNNNSSYSSDKNEVPSSTVSNSKGPSSAFIGNRAVAELGPVFACPDWKDYKKVIADLVNHDRVGEGQDYLQGGCTTITKGDTGLIIDSGFDSIQVRLDKDETAYWTESMFGDPVRPLFVCISGSKCGP
jgi:hypothetical protein